MAEEKDKQDIIEDIETIEVLPDEEVVEEEKDDKSQEVVAEETTEEKDDEKGDEEVVEEEVETTEKPVGQKEVDAAVDKAPAAKPLPKTKAGMVADMHKKLSSMKKEDLSAMYGKIVLGEDLEEEDTTVSEKTDVDFSEDLNALVESEDTLSEGFKDKAGVIFEAAISSKLAEKTVELEEKYAEQLEAEVSEVESKIVESIDAFLNDKIEAWIEENAVAIKYNAKAELAESFLTGMKTLFTENYVSIPEEKVDVLEELSREHSELQEQVIALSDKNVELSESIEQLTREGVFAELSESLTATQSEKFKNLLEDVEFEDKEQYVAKAKIVLESYFGKSSPTISEASDDEEISEDNKILNEQMSLYVQALSKK